MKLHHLQLGELGAVICGSLEKEGLKVTLSGGACVQIYCDNEYVTDDLDFVVDFMWPENRKTIEKVMTDLGFRKRGRIYMNEDVPYSVEFPPGPIGIGDDYRIRPVEKKFKTGTLMLLSPTDSVKDRLAGYFYGNDNQCLDQALLLCKSNKVDMQSVREWAERENRLSRFEEFESLLAGG